MTKTMLGVAIGGAFLAVGAIGAVTATVIAGNEDGGSRMVRQLTPPPAPGQAPPLGRRGGRGERRFGPFGPGRRGGQGFGGLPRLDALRTCLEQQGLGGRDRPGRLPDVQKMRKALEACRGAMPQAPPAP